MKRTGKIVLNDAIKKATEDQDKIISPRQTINKFKSRLKFLGLDILENTVRTDNGRLGIPVFFSTCGVDAFNTIGTKKQMGKGATASQAEASALMELAERYSFFDFYKNQKNTIIDTYDNLPDEVLSFELIAKSVHDESSDLELSKKFFQSLPLRWTGAYNLSTSREVIIPLDWFYAINEFNGSSAGNCVEEALCQGICEVVERHVSSLISENKLATPKIDIESITDSLVLEMLEKYFKENISLYITDFTFKMGIPSVGVLAYDPMTFSKSSEIVWTAGTAPDPQKALSRALAEVAQLAGDFNTFSNYEASGLPKFTCFNESSFVVDGTKSISITKLPDISDYNIKNEVNSCIETLGKANMNVIVIDTTNSMLRVPSFYTIIPGAHFRERAVKTSVAMISAKIISENFKPSEAIFYLKNMNKLMPRKYFVQFYMGKFYLEQKMYNKSISHFAKALDLEPDKQDIPSIYSYLGLCFKDLGQHKEAIKVLEKAELVDKERTDIYNLKGFCYFMLKDHEEAIDNFSKAIKLNPGSAIDYANIASNYREMGGKKEAIRYYKMALEIDPSIEFAVKNLEILLSK